MYRNKVTKMMIFYAGLFFFSGCYVYGMRPSGHYNNPTQQKILSENELETLDRNKEPLSLESKIKLIYNIIEKDKSDEPTKKICIGMLIPNINALANNNTIDNIAQDHDLANILNKIIKHEKFSDIHQTITTDKTYAGNKESFESSLKTINDKLNQSKMPTIPIFPGQGSATQENKPRMNVPTTPFNPNTPMTSHTTNQPKTVTKKLSDPLQKVEGLDAAELQKKQKSLCESIDKLNQLCAQKDQIDQEKVAAELITITQNIDIATPIDAWKLNRIFSSNTIPTSLGQKINTIRSNLNQMKGHSNGPQLKFFYQGPIEYEKIKSYRNISENTPENVIYCINHFFTHGCLDSQTKKFTKNVIFLSPFLNNSQYKTLIKSIAENKDFQTICRAIEQGTNFATKQDFVQAYHAINKQFNVEQSSEQELPKINLKEQNPGTQPKTTVAATSFFSNFTAQKLVLGGATAGILGVIAFIVYMSRNNPSFLDKIPFLSRIFGLGK